MEPASMEAAMTFPTTGIHIGIHVTRVVTTATKALTMTTEETGIRALPFVDHVVETRDTPGLTKGMKWVALPKGTTIHVVMTGGEIRITKEARSVTTHVAIVTPLKGEE